MYVDIYHYPHTYCTYVGVARAVVGGYLVPTYIPILLTYPNRLRKDCRDDPGTSTRPELPGSVPDFFAGSNL